MNDNLLMIGLIIAGVLLANRMATAKATGSGGASNAPIYGSGGTIWTGDKQFFYDGYFWYQLGPNGYQLIDGQP